MKLADFVEGNFDIEETFSQDLVSIDGNRDDKIEPSESSSQHLKVRSRLFSAAEHSVKDPVQIYIPRYILLIQY